MSSTEDEFDQRPRDERTPSERNWAPREQNSSISPSEGPPPVQIPPEALSADTLDALIESYVLREGTDYGVNEVALETKTVQIRRQLDRGDIKIVFDPASESVTLILKRDLPKP
jgi:uncharacterized protein YheU (UPF0270 family)